VPFLSPPPAGDCDLPQEWRAVLRVLWLVGVAAVLVVSCLPASSPPIQALDALPLSDKLQHAAAYLALAFLPALHEERRAIVALALGLIAMGAGLEFCQLLAEGRYFSVADMAADLGGVLLGTGVGLAARGWIGLAARRNVPEF